MKETASMQYDGADTPVLIRLPDLSPQQGPGGRRRESRHEERSEKRQQRRSRRGTSENKSQRSLASASRSSWREYRTPALVVVGLAAVLGFTYSLIHGDRAPEHQDEGETWSVPFESAPVVDSANPAAPEAAMVDLWPEEPVSNAAVQRPAQQQARTVAQEPPSWNSTQSWNSDMAQGAVSIPDPSALDASSPVDLQTASPSSPDSQAAGWPDLPGHTAGAAPGAESVGGWPQPGGDSANAWNEPGAAASPRGPGASGVPSSPVPQAAGDAWPTPGLRTGMRNSTYPNVPSTTEPRTRASESQLNGIELPDTDHGTSTRVF